MFRDLPLPALLCVGRAFIGVVNVLLFFVSLGICPTQSLSAYFLFVFLVSFASLGYAVPWLWPPAEKKILAAIIVLGAAAGDVLWIIEGLLAVLLPSQHACPWIASYLTAMICLSGLWLIAFTPVSFVELHRRSE